MFLWIAESRCDVAALDVFAGDLPEPGFQFCITVVPLLGVFEFCVQPFECCNVAALDVVAGHQFW
jgi:hypothetical protein